MNLLEKTDLHKLAGAPSAEHKLLRYLLILFAVPFSFELLPFYLVRLPLYEKWSRTHDFRPLDFAFKAAGQNADVVIFGDSSAYHGINANQMSVAIGKKVLLLPSNLGELLVDRDLPLERYIAIDKPPRLIVFYFSPWGFDYSPEEFDIAPKYDGMEMLVRHGTAREILAFAVAHPLFTVQFPLQFFRTNSDTHPVDAASFRKQSELLATTNGHDETPGTTRANSGCVVPSRLIDRIRFDWMLKMSKKYSTPKTQVFLFVAPIPNCTNAQTVIDRAASVIPAAPPKKMSANVFADDNYYIHLYPDGVPEATQSLIDAVRPLLTSQKRGENNMNKSITDARQHRP